jgi:hypothetical protein
VVPSETAELAVPPLLSFTWEGLDFADYSEVLPYASSRLLLLTSALHKGCGGGPATQVHMVVCWTLSCGTDLLLTGITGGGIT